MMLSGPDMIEIILILKTGICHAMIYIQIAIKHNYINFMVHTNWSIYFDENYISIINNFSVNRYDMDW